MTKFVHGPANGKVLMLHRSPYFLRVTKTADGEFDALDQLGDTPRPDESLFAYQMKGDSGTCHVLMTNRKASGFYAIATYIFCDPQPSDDVMRTQDAWQSWCLSQPDPTIGPNHQKGAAR